MDTRGIYDKFSVRRNDGSDAPGSKHDGCRYFVIDLAHDPAASATLSAYADACESDRPQLASDLRELAALTADNQG